jgi:hypothetical protein
MHAGAETDKVFSGSDVSYHLRVPWGRHRHGDIAATGLPIAAHGPTTSIHNA